MDAPAFSGQVAGSVITGTDGRAYTLTLAGSIMGAPNTPILQNGSDTGLYPNCTTWNGTNLLGCPTTTSTTTCNGTSYSYTIRRYTCTACNLSDSVTILNATKLTIGYWYYDPNSGHAFIVDTFNGCSGSAPNRTVLDSTQRYRCNQWIGCQSITTTTSTSGAPTTTTTTLPPTTTTTTAPPTTTSTTTLGTNFLPVSNGGTILYSRIYLPTSTIVTGTFTSYRNPSLVTASANRIATINNDLTLTSTYTVDGGFSEAFPDVTNLKQQTDGKIIATGSFASYGDAIVATNNIVRILTNGDTDGTFNAAHSPGFNAPTRQLDIDSIGKIYVTGIFTTFNSNSYPRIVRMNADGTEDPTFTVNEGFNGETSGVSVLPGDNGVIVVGSFSQYRLAATEPGIARLDTNGISQSMSIGGFSPNVGVAPKSIARFPGQTSFYVAGQFNQYTGVTVGNIVKMSDNGVIDNTFTQGNGFNATVNTIEVVWTNKLFITGTFTEYDAQPALGFIVLNADGTILFRPTVQYYTPIIIGNNLYARTSTGSLQVVYTNP